MTRVVLLLLPLMACSEEIASDDFSYDAQDWGIEGMTTVQSTLTLVKDEDDPHLCATDMGLTTMAFWQYVAPAKYHGDARRAFGKRITWDSKLSTPDDAVFPSTDLYLSGIGITLVVSIPKVPNRTPAWTAFSVRLDTSAPWRFEGSGALATDDDMKSVLSHVTNLRIPGGQRNGGETSCIDDVFFGIP